MHDPDQETMKKSKPQMSEDEILDLLDLIPGMDAGDIVRVLGMLQSPLDRRVKAAFEKRIERLGKDGSRAELVKDAIRVFRLLLGS